MAVIDRYINCFRTSPLQATSPAGKFETEKQRHISHLAISACLFTIAVLVIGIAIPILLFSPVVTLAAPIMLAIGVPVAAFALTTLVLSIISLVRIDSLKTTATSPSSTVTHNIYDLDNLKDRKAIITSMLNFPLNEGKLNQALNQDLTLINLILDESNPIIQRGLLAQLNAGKAVLQTFN